MNAEQVRDLVASWQADAAARRRRTPNDPVADALDACAAELQERFAEAALEPLSPEEWGAIHGGVTPQTVTTWIRSGELEAYKDNRGRWRIPVTSERRRMAA